jgi:hypothetical protein
MKHIKSVFAFAVVLAAVAPELAQAQGMTEAPAEATAPAESKAWLGAHFGMSPSGTMKVDVGSMLSGESGTSTAYEVGGQFEYRITPFISIGAAPALVFNVQGDGAKKSATLLDLPLRVSAGADVAPSVRLYGFAAPGYTILFPPSESAMNDNASGFMIGFGGGAAFKVAPKVALTGEVGYQFRFPSQTVQSVDVSLQVNYLTFAVGIAAGI